MVNKKEANGISSLKTYFLIVNMVLAVVAFSWMVSAPGSSTPPTTPVKTEMGAQVTAIKDVAVYKKATMPAEKIFEIGEDTVKTTDLYELNGKYFVDNVGEKIPVSEKMLSANGINTQELKFGEVSTKATAKGGSSMASKLFNLPTGYAMDAIVSGAQYALITYFIVKLGADMFGVDKPLANALAAATSTGFGLYKLLTTATQKSWLRTIFGFGKTPKSWSPIAHPGLWSIGAAIVVFILIYKKESTEIVEFQCKPWQAPTGGDDCEKCNTIEGGCSEYRCKSLGQACGIINAGTENEKCAWLNPHDVNSPVIKMSDILAGYIWKPDDSVRPPATGVVISRTNGDCVEAFTALEFTLTTDEPSQCKIDYNLTKGDIKAKVTAFDEMSYYVGGDSLFSYNHTEKMSLPSPDAINAVAPELKNDGTYTLYIRCQDANGNFNQDAYSLRFCVEAGPDTTPPRIESVSIPSNSPVQYNQTSIDLEVYVNEPAECKWSREDRIFDNMENTMSCSTNLWEMNNNNVYTCSLTLTGIKNREENNYYFRCKDQPNAAEGDRNVNMQSYKYILIGTQPLNILKVGPNETIRGSTDTVPVYLTAKTDNGYNNGEAICYFSTTGNENDYIEFAETGTNEHEQRQDLTAGSYTYYYKCVDLGGNAAYDSTTFSVEVDRTAPIVVRVYRETDLKIITNEKSICSYSNKDCNFEIADGISMPYDNEPVHTAEWKMQKYYIRCKDEYDNQPDPNRCSIVASPYSIGENVIVL